MKFDDLLALFLYENKSLQLQGIGTFTLDSNVALPHANEKEVYYPIEGLSYTYNPKDITNEELITFLVRKLGKIQPLVRSDLESYLSNVKQFINIGKPYTIEGIGTLQKNNQGTYEFTPGNFLPVKEFLSPHKDNPENLHRERVRKSESGRTTTIIMIIVVIVIIAAGAIWALSISNSTNDNNGITADMASDSTEKTNIARRQDTLEATATRPTVALPGVNDTGRMDYKMIFDVTKSRERILARSERLRKDGVFFRVDTISNNDTPVYRMFIPKKLRTSDTLKVRDSLVKFFAKRIIVEKRQ